MPSTDERMMESGETAGPRQEPGVRPIRKFGETRVGSERNLPRFVLSDLEGEEVIIHSVESFDGRFGPGYRVVIDRVSTGERGVLLGHWSVLSKYLTAMVDADELPVAAVIVRAEGKRYFDLADRSELE